jgi:hypothetical protein
VTARDIALRAHEQALAASAAEQQAREARQAEDARREHERHEERFEAALPMLTAWFPGVEWTWRAMGNYNNDTVLWDASENWPPSFKLKVTWYMIDMNQPEAGRRVEIKVGDFRPDTSMPGHSYFAGSVVQSAADVGRYLAGQEGTS